MAPISSALFFQIKILSKNRDKRDKITDWVFHIDKLIKLHKPGTKAILIFETLKNNDKKIEIKTFCSTNNTKQQLLLSKRWNYKMFMKYKIVSL
jgi:hypothetical protein